jgi:ribosomal protein S18 acetylase RimI-like enzyme
MRADRDGRLYVLEVNPNPDMGPSAGMAIQARAASMTYRQLVDAILSIRIGREVVHGESETVLCPAMNGDLETLVRLTDETGFFRAEEVETAREVLDEGLEDGATSGYFVQVAAVGGEPAGYVCVGPTPMTRGTWDVYWLAVSPAFQRRGLGRMLMEWAEEYIRECGGLRSVIETSSTDQYVPTRAFYQKAGYREICQIPDYYDIGDSKVILFKSLVGGTKSCNQNPGQQSQATFKAYPNPGA